MSLLTLLRKEVKTLLRSRLLLVVLILYPLVIVGIIGYAFSQPNQPVPVAIVNEDVDPVTGQPNDGTVENPIEGEEGGVTITTTDIIQRLEPFADMQFTTFADGKRKLLTGEVQAVVRFPPNFVRDIVNLDSNGQIEVVIDQSDPVRATFMEVLVRGIVQSFQEEIIESKVELVIQAINRSLNVNLDTEDPLYPGFRGVRERLMDLQANHEDYSPEEHQKLAESIAFLDTIVDTLEDSREIVRSVAQPVQLALEQEESGNRFLRDLVVPAALGLGIFWTGALATSTLVVYEREAPAYARLRITPATGFGIYGAKIVLTTAIILAQSLVILSIAVLGWNTRIDNMPLTLLIILLSSAASMGVGLFVSGLTRDVNGAVLLSVLVTFPMMFLSGLFFPVNFMPPGAQWLAQAFPLTHTVAGLRGAMLRGFSFDVAAPILASLAAFALVLSAIGIVMGKRLESRA